MPDDEALTRISTPFGAPFGWAATDGLHPQVREVQKEVVAISKMVGLDPATVLYAQISKEEAHYWVRIR